MPGDEGTTLFGRPVDRRTLLAMTSKVLAGGTLAGMWLSPELAHYVEAASRGHATGGSLTVMKQFSPNLASWKKAMAQFTRETGIAVKLDDQNYNNQYQKIATQGQSGVSGDDVVEIDTIWAGSFASAGFTLDLTSFLPASVMRQIAPPSVAAVGYKGKLYGVPEYNSSKHFFYNKKMLDSVGLKQPPATLNDLLRYCEVLKANKAKLGIQYPMSWSWIQQEALTCDFVTVIDALGGRFFATDNVTPVFNKGAGVQALNTMKMMLDKGYVAPGSLTHTETDVENDILSGKTAMSTNWEGTMADSLDPKRTVKGVLGQIRMALIPGSSARRSGSCLGPEGFAIMKTSQHQAEAKAFLNWWVTKKIQVQFMQTFDQYPIVSTQSSEPTWRVGNGREGTGVYSRH